MLFHFRHNRKALIPIFLLLSPLTGFAADPASTADTEINRPILPTVTIEATRLDPLIGASTLSKELIERHPNRNGSVNELLSIIPGVQFAEEKDSSFEGGEIKPPSLSISGGRVSDNNFLIDGIGNNSLLDPLFETPNSPSNIPGNPQEIFIGTNLVEQVTVYEHNIPARFGGFTGGVIETKTKDPSFEYEGILRYKTTNNNWTRFHVDPTDQDEFTNSDSVDQQPSFGKHYANGEINIPLTHSSGLLASYEQRYSNIPLLLLTKKEKQTRRIETYFLKYLLEVSETDTLRLTATYSPSEEKRFLRDTKDSQFTLHNDAWVLSANYQMEGLTGDTEFRAAYRASLDRREAPNVLISWDAEIAGIPTSKDWGILVDNNFSKEGGLGDLERTQQSIDLSSDWQSISFLKGNFEHSINLGFQLEGFKAELNRKAAATSYSTPKAEAVICDPTDTTCVNGEQFLSKRKIYNINRSSVRTIQYSLYTEDSISFKRLTLRPGARYSYDDLMENHNFSPRLAASYDLTNNQNTILIGGLNRYYDRSMLTYKLREAIAPFSQQKRTFDTLTSTLTPWADSTYFSPLDSQFTRLKTPHVDEQSLGVDQALLGGRMLIEYIQRQYTDQLAKEVDPFDSTNPTAVRHITLNNNGRKDYKSYRAAWERQWADHFLSINISFEEVESSNDSYDDSFDDLKLAEQIWYKNQLIFLYDLPRDDYTRPWTCNLTWTAKLPHQITFTNVTKYQSHYDRLDDTFKNAADGNDIYDMVRRPSILIFDWRIAWELPSYKEKTMALSLDIYNAFNRKNHIGTEDNQFGLGRQFWAGFELKF